MKASLFTNNVFCNRGKQIMKVIAVSLGFLAMSFNVQANTATVAVDSSNADQALEVAGTTPFSIPELIFSQDLDKSESARNVKALSRIINDNIKYPEAAYKKHIQGSVKVEFSVSPYGDINDIIVDSKANPILAKEVIRCVQLTSGMWAASSDDTYKISIDFEL